jgi:phospholipid/cholesterol/gamma-HCH transport system substrate-binding protein
MEKQAPSLGRILVAVGFALSCFGLLLFLWVAFGGPVPMKPRDYRVTAYFPEAASLAVESDVRIGGVPVGKVKSIELASADVRVNGKDTTAAELEIEPEFAPINSDARAIIRQKTLQGEAYVELTPGTEPAERGTVPSGTEGTVPEEPSVSLGPAANVSDAEAEAAEPVEEGGDLGIGTVEEATQFDEILNAFDEETRRATRSLTGTGARALRGRGIDLSDGLGNLGPFLEDAEEIAETVRAERPAMRGLVRDTGAVLESLAADDRALRGAVTGLEQTFGGLADANEPLAESLQILPTFEREADLTLERLDRLGDTARPVVAKLLPVASDVPPTLASVRELAPHLESTLRESRGLIQAARRGLPALEGTLNELGPVFDSLDPFLAELNPVLTFLRAYRERAATFFSNPHIGLAGSLPEIPNQPAPRHALRVLFHFSPESLAIHPTRLNTNRGNAYMRPNGYTEGLEELYIPSFDCKNTDYTYESQDPDEDERLPRVVDETFQSDGGDPEIGYDYASCGIGNPFGNFGGGRAPQLFADP